jgi:hypothetical protein
MTVAKAENLVLYWVRLGCVRIKFNLALEQLLWMRNHLGARVAAVCFVTSNPESAEEVAFASALAEFHSRLRRECGVELFTIGAAQEEANVLALWCRHDKVSVSCFDRSRACIFRGKSYKMFPSAGSKLF